ncbi:hypothetical protein Tcan_17692 [Toxocara canis]|uniref:Uncharacterized protein n=1 Tax=Toxocara canis TaxID=6265 RepID=A0A0B2V004_TOXCA|nr:hypothetical protein Tcan_17692 [Toxocara canis]
MLSKFARKETSMKREITRNTLQYLLQKDSVSTRTQNEVRPEQSGKRPASGTRSKRMQWHVNPLYKTKGNESTDVDEFEVSSRQSSSSKRSISKSVNSFDSDYKSESDTNEWLEWPNKWMDDSAHEQVSISQGTDDFCKAASNLLDAIRAFGEHVEENSALAQILCACEVELLKITIM